VEQRRKQQLQPSFMTLVFFQNTIRERRPGVIIILVYYILTRQKSLKAKVQRFNHQNS